MYIVRTIPAKIPEGRNYVVDQIDTVPLNDYDMRFLIDLNDSVILLEWDIAVAKHDLYNFVTHANQSPNQVHVAPFVLYPDSLDEIQSPVWAHRHMVNMMPLQLQWIDYGDPVCDIFTTGMIYLPKEITKRIGESDDLIHWHNNITDSKLAFWYYHTIGEKVPVHWDVRPVHLHYDQEVFYDDRNVRRFGSRTRPAALSNR